MHTTHKLLPMGCGDTDVMGTLTAERNPSLSFVNTIAQCCLREPWAPAASILHFPHPHNSKQVNGIVGYRPALPSSLPPFSYSFSPVGYICFRSECKANLIWAQTFSLSRCSPSLLGPPVNQIGENAGLPKYPISHKSELKLRIWGLGWTGLGGKGRELSPVATLMNHYVLGGVKTMGIS